MKIMTGLGFNPYRHAVSDEVIDFIKAVKQFKAAVEKAEPRRIKGAA